MAILINRMSPPGHKKEIVLKNVAAMKQWPYWNEVYLNCVKESPLSYESFVQAVQAGDASREAFEDALTKSRMSREAFNLYLPEYQKYMALISAYEDVGMLSDGVDHIWHSHMLVSARYEQFCMEFFGEMIHHFPCSLYELYGVNRAEAKDSCLAICNPTTCKDGGGGGGCKTASNEDNPQAIKEGILRSASVFVEAYTDVFGDPPSVTIWNQLARM